MFRKSLVVLLLFMGTASCEQQESTSEGFSNYLGRVFHYSGTHLPLPSFTSYLMRALGSYLANDSSLECSFQQPTVLEVGGRPCSIDNALIFINGLNVTQGQCTRVGDWMSGITDQGIVCVYNNTAGLAWDLARTVLESFSYETESVVLLRDVICEKFYGGYETITLFCHSEGSLITYLAVEHLPKTIRDRMQIFAFGPVNLIPKSFAGRAENFVSDTDPIPKIDLARIKNAKEQHRYHIEIIDPAPGASAYFDHLLMGKTYQDRFERILSSLCTSSK